MPKKLYFFGDSICVGQHTPVHETWVHRISEELRNVTDLLVLNASVNGNTTRMALERMYFDVLSHTPDFLYIQFGLNDCNYWATDKGMPRVSIDSYLANLVEMVDKAHAAGVSKILVNTNHKTSLNDKFVSLQHTFEDSNTKYYEALLNLRYKGSIDIKLIDIRKYIDDFGAEPESYLLPDGIHLNSVGHDYYFDYICPQIKSMVMEK